MIFTPGGCCVLQGVDSALGIRAAVSARPAADPEQRDAGPARRGETTGRAHSGLHKQRAADDRGDAQPEISFTAPNAALARADGAVFLLPGVQE